MYKVDLDSIFRLTADKYDTRLKKAWEFLVNLINVKYGVPTKDFGYPDFLNIKSEYIVNSNIWVLKNKQINIGVGCADEFRYYLSLTICNTDILKLKKK